MSSISLISHELLFYNAQYGVLICLECKYAIQKSALASHLLRHKIYRTERQNLLASIAELELHEPEDVLLPGPNSPSIEGLPVIEGYSCTIAGCGNLCASEKRMRRHWSDSHGEVGVGGGGECGRKAKIQTFFRGTKIRYFEVDGASGGHPATASTVTMGDDGDIEEGGVEEDQGLQMIEPQVSAQPQREPTPPAIPLSVISTPAPVDINLDTLTYFHSFTTTTCVTLPTPAVNDVQPTTHYWQAEVVPLSLSRRWLMCGLLAISACHFAVLSNNDADERTHFERAALFCSEFTIGRAEAGMSTSGSGAKEELAKKAGMQISSFLRLARCSMRNRVVLDSRIVPGLFPVPPLQLVLFVIRGFVNTDIAPRFHSVGGGIDHGDDGMEALDETSAGIILLSRLNNLPVRIGEVFGTPSSSDMKDVLATISAIAALINACETSFASTSVETVWKSMATWTVKVADRFSDMVSRNHPAALVVVAHWVMLIERAELCGCWFLRGAADWLMKEIAEKLRKESEKVRALIEGLRE